MMRTLALLALIAGTARADVWQDAIERKAPDPNRDNYEQLLRVGDEFAVRAMSRSTSPRDLRELVKQAADKYRAAAAAEPTEGEPYYRLGYLLFSFYLDCTVDPQSPRGISLLCRTDPMLFDRQKAEEVIAAWNAFEQRAPLDPRFTVVPGGRDLLFERAILHTKLATKEHLEAATRDYREMLARSDGGPSSSRENALSNLAETYMMLGDLEQAIETYRQALATGPSVDTAYGLAVALDRDERGAEAADVILQQSWEAFDGPHGFRTKVTVTHVTFFVPQGEQDYYFALIYEAFGYDDDALRNWKSYIQSGAHPEFQPRAKAHIDGIYARRKAHPDQDRHAPEMRIDFP